MVLPRRIFYGLMALFDLLDPPEERSMTMNNDLTPAEEEVLRGMAGGYQVERRDGSDDGY